VRQWVPEFGKPLRPKEVLSDIAELVAPYPGASQVVTDQWSADALRDLAQPLGLVIWDKPWGAERKVTVFGDLRTAMQEQSLELPADPQLRSDLQCVRKVTTQSGVAIRLVKVGKRHADYAPALALAHEQCTRSPDEREEPPARDAFEAATREGARLKREALEAATAAQMKRNREFLRRIGR
jgi:hypothetical protein